MSVLQTKSADSGKKVESIKISEMFLSLQGEGVHSGIPCFFIRTSGCDLRCSYCDTGYAFSEGKKLEMDHLLSLVPEGVPLIQITGGEPLIQEKAVLELINQLSLHRKLSKILLETGGHRSIEKIPESVHIVLDVKLPGSGEERNFLKQNFNFLKISDEIKFVISDRKDFNSASEMINRYKLNEVCSLLFSPVHGKLHPEELAEWILKENLNVRLMLQLHKIIWGEKRGV
ncbi:MAG: 4Fe-4S cluster-binding domain-containing protein [Spirochaetia bacterium]|nr:4Fe-4S cluster-binding domain-containing protein [Spirochaetia bacterium]